MLVGDAGRKYITVHKPALRLGQRIGDFQMGTVKVTAEHSGREVAQVLFRQRAQPSQRARNVVPVEQGQQVAPVAASPLGPIVECVEGHIPLLAELYEGGRIGKGGCIGGTKRVLIGQTPVQPGRSVGRNLRTVGMGRRRSQGKSLRKLFAAAVGQLQHHVVATCTHGGKGITAAVGSPYHEVAFSCHNRGLALAVGDGALHGVELSIVIHLKGYRSLRAGLACGVGHSHGGTHGGGIVRSQVDFGVTGIGIHDFASSPITAKDLGVHQHSARSRLVEPGQVEHGLGFAGSHEVPRAIHPHFHPSMVVVGMCPARGIDLPGGNAHGAQGCHGERTFLAAAACRSEQGGHGR